jgi:23S rRNA (guanosine2251-2'-O)-methyltransferase
MASEKKSFTYGIRPVMEAIAAGQPIDKVLIRNGLKGEFFQEFFAAVRQQGIPFQFVPPGKLDRITRKNHQGVIAFLSPVDFYRIEEVLPGLFEQGKNPFLLILDGVTDVRNFGAILRTAECAGVQGVIIPQKNFARVSEDTAKTSAGALYRIPLCRATSLEDAIEYLKKSGIQVIGVTEKTQTDYYQLDMSNPTALVMGSEDRGISPALMQKVHFLARIPLAGEIESLNVSVAAGIMIYEAVRQRKT